VHTNYPPTGDVFFVSRTISQGVACAVMWSNI